jgi:hypothetical protein
MQTPGCSRQPGNDPRLQLWQARYVSDAGIQPQLTQQRGELTAMMGLMIEHVHDQHPSWQNPEHPIER